MKASPGISISYFSLHSRPKSAGPPVPGWASGFDTSFTPPPISPHPTRNQGSDSLSLSKHFQDAQISDDVKMTLFNQQHNGDVVSPVEERLDGGI